LSLARRVREETLDALAPHDPRAQRSRRDLVRVHRAMGTRGTLVRALRDPPRVPGTPDALDPLDVLELGAGDGTLMLGVARRIAGGWPPVRLTLLDRVDIVTGATRAGFADLGWQVEVVTTDVLDWATREPPGPARCPDLIVTSLFVHHFEGAALGALLGAIAARTQRFVACEPRRDRFALAGSHLVALLGANAVTREDAVLSVHAGFRDAEIGASWPDPDGVWKVREGRGGAFGHLFDARRRAAVPDRCPIDEPPVSRR